jgi:hypothetical protein
MAEINPPPTEDSKPDDLTVALYTQMFALAGAMVGVCLTVIGVFRLIIEAKGYRTMGDDLVAVDGILFLVACLFSFATLKATTHRRRHLFRRMTDFFFILAIGLMMGICAVITWAFAHTQN